MELNDDIMDEFMRYLQAYYGNRGQRRTVGGVEPVGMLQQLAVGDPAGLAVALNSGIMDQRGLPPVMPGDIAASQQSGASMVTLLR